MTALRPGANPPGRRWVTAGKDHRCNGCGAPIRKGDRYWRSLLHRYCAPICEATGGNRS